MKNKNRSFDTEKTDLWQRFVVARIIKMNLSLSLSFSRLNGTTPYLAIILFFNVNQTDYTFMKRTDTC